MKKFLPVLLSIKAILILFSIQACTPVNYYNPETDSPDLAPPQLQSIYTLTSTQIALEFNEETELITQKTTIYPSLTILSISHTPTKPNRIIIEVSKQTPGIIYKLKTEATDKNSNSISFIKSFYGHNDKIPNLLINEFTVRGSGKHPDTVELYILSNGNMGGITVYNGTSKNFTNLLVFPPFEVKKDDFILLHFKPTGDESEINETEKKNSSGGYDCSNNAYDFWVKGGKGLGGNNGVITVYSAPNGEIIDGILYSNRTSTSDTKYRGFGKKDMLLRAETLANIGGWTFRGDKISPEDAINPEGSTGTRSICRNNPPRDTNSSMDWHIVPTRGATFGNPNTNSVYTK